MNRQQITRFARTKLGRKFPERFGAGRYSHFIDEYQVKNLILEDGKVPLTWFTYKSNFGDLLSPWLMKQMTGVDPVLADRSRPHYVMIGSITDKGSDHSILWGTGTYGTESKSEVNGKAKYTAVRGPLTRAKLNAKWGFGIKVPEVYGDPAILVPLYYRPKVKVTHDYGVVVRWSERKWAEATYGPGVKLIDFARGDIEGVLDDMLSCKRIISSSLHGLIIADAYGIPNAWLASTTPRGGEYKFIDYFASVDKYRRPQKFDASVAPVTKAALAKAFDFDGTAITFDYRALLDACPFLERKPRGAAR